MNEIKTSKILSLLWFSQLQRRQIKKNLIQFISQLITHLFNIFIVNSFTEFVTEDSTLSQ